MKIGELVQNMEGVKLQEHGDFISLHFRSWKYVTKSYFIDIIF